MNKHLLAVCVLLYLTQGHLASKQINRSVKLEESIDDQLHSEQVSSDIRKMLRALELGLESEPEMIAQRTKKLKPMNEEFDEDPKVLFNHRRKNFFKADEEERKKQESEMNKPKTCAGKMSSEANVIIDTKKSLAKGAKLLNIDYISKNAATIKLNALQMSCMKICCDNSECDTALLSMKLGEVSQEQKLNEEKLKIICFVQGRISLLSV